MPKEFDKFDYYLKSVQEEKALSEIPLKAYASILEDGKRNKFHSKKFITGFRHS